MRSFAEEPPGSEPRSTDPCGELRNSPPASRLDADCATVRFGRGQDRDGVAEILGQEQESEGVGSALN